MNPMQRRRLRAAGKLGSPGPWGEVMIPQQQQEEAMEAPLKKPLIGSPQIDENHRRSQRMKITRPAVAPDPTSTAMWSSSSRSRTRASRSSSCAVQQGGSLPSEGNSDHQWCCWSQDPSQVNKGQEGSESSVVTDDEAIAVQSLLALELLGSSIQDSAASKKKKPKSSRTKKKKKKSTAAAATTTTSISTGIAATRRVFVPALGITILQRRVEPRRAAPRSGELSHPGLGEEEEEEEDQQSGDLEHPRSRSKRKRAGKMPPKFQDSVLLINQQKKPPRKKSRRV